MPDKKIAWYNRYNEFINISKTKNVECLDSEEVFIEKTKLNRKNAFIKLYCL